MNLFRIHLGPQSCAHPLTFVWGMIDLYPSQQVGSFRVNEESYLNYCAPGQRSNLAGQVQREGIPDLCV